MHSNLVEKLHPLNFQGMEPAVASMLGIVLRSDFTMPAFEEFQVTTEGMVYMHANDGATAPVFVGPLSQVQALLMRVAAAAKLTSSEFKSFEELFSQVTGARLYH